MESTASTIAGVSFSARVPLSFVDKDVLATDSSSSRSTSFSSLKLSRNYRSRLLVRYRYRDIKDIKTIP